MAYIHSQNLLISLLRFPLHIGQYLISGWGPVLFAIVCSPNQNIF